MGCMFSGKSSEIIRIINKYNVLKKNMLIINHSLDNRYEDNNIVTHNKIKMKCISLDKLMGLLSNEDNKLYNDLYNSCDIVLIEESQFFPDLYEFVTISADKNNKTVI